MEDGGSPCRSTFVSALSVESWVGFLFWLLAIAAGGLIGSIVTSAAGAVALLYFISRCKKT